MLNLTMWALRRGAQVGAPPAPWGPASSLGSIATSRLLLPAPASQRFCLFKKEHLLPEPCFLSSLTSASVEFICHSFPGTLTICVQTLLKTFSQVPRGQFLSTEHSGSLKHWSILLKKVLSIPSDCSFSQFYCSYYGWLEVTSAPTPKDGPTEVH